MNFSSPIKSTSNSNTLHMLHDSPSRGFVSPSALFDNSSDRNAIRVGSVPSVPPIQASSAQKQSNQLSANRSPQASQFKTPQKYQDRFIPARTDSISKTLFDLKDESTAMEEEASNTTVASNNGLSGTTIHPGMSPHMSLDQSLMMPATTLPIPSMLSGGTPGSQLIFSTPSKKKPMSFQQDENTKNYSDFMQKELFGTSSTNDASILKFSCDPSAKQQSLASPFHHHHNPNQLASSSPFSLQSPDRNPKDEKRKISKTPFKVLDAPGLQDDFYIDLLDWSSRNEIGVGLGKAIFIWNAGTGTVAKLCENLNPFRSQNATDLLDSNGNSLNIDQSSAASYYTSLKWSPNGTHMAIGNQEGKVDYWDVQEQKILRTFYKQSERIGSLDFNNNNVFAAGSKDKSILIQDIRDPRILKMAIGHKQEVCQVRWSPDQQFLASGGNDNTVFIWNFNRSASEMTSNSSYKMQPFQKNTEHKAAVRALAWNPHQYGILLSGGGSRDQTIKVWNVNTNSVVSSINVGSQVCKLQFSPDQNEFVAAHGFEYNRITVWKYPIMQQIAELEGHQSRVLFMSLSPDAQNIVTGAGDETLKLWKVFNGKPPVQRSQLSQLADLR